MASSKHPDYPPLIQDFIAQLCSREFMHRWYKHGCDTAKVDVILHGTRGKTIDTLPPTIVLHTG